MLSFSLSPFPSTQSPSLHIPSPPTTNPILRLNPPQHQLNFQQSAYSSSRDNNKAEDFPIENANTRANPIEGSDDRVLFGRKKKKGKEKVYWVCSDCGYTTGQWWGVCRSCSVSGTMKEFHEAKSSDSNGKVSGFSVMENGLGSWLPQQSGELRPLRLSEVNRELDHLHWRIPL